MRYQTGLTIVEYTGDASARQVCGKPNIGGCGLCGVAQAGLALFPLWEPGLFRDLEQTGLLRSVLVSR